MLPFLPSLRGCAIRRGAGVVHISNRKAKFRNSVKKSITPPAPPLLAFGQGEEFVVGSDSTAYDQGEEFVVGSDCTAFD